MIKLYSTIIRILKFFGRHISQQGFRFKIKPSFLVIGEMKCGTTFVFNLLKQHESLDLPSEKEINYFSMYYAEGPRWYRMNFPRRKKKHKLTGEATPDYFYHPLAPARANKYNPEFKLIVLLRNPVNRAIPHYNMIKNRYKLKPFHDILKYTKQEILVQSIKEQEIIKKNKNLDKIHKNFSFISRGIYINQINKWEKYFPKENFLFLKSEDLFNDPISTMNTICDFLRTEKFESLDLNVFKFNGEYYDPINEDVICYLKEFYKPYNKMLEEHLNRKFNWD